MTDIVVTKIVGPHQDIVVLAGDDYVVLELSYPEPDHREQQDEVNASVLLAPTVAERLACALDSAAVKAREVAQFIATATGRNS